MKDDAKKVVKVMEHLHATGESSCSRCKNALTNGGFFCRFCGASTYYSGVDTNKLRKTCEDISGYHDILKKSSQVIFENTGLRPKYCSLCGTKII